MPDSLAGDTAILRSDDPHVPQLLAAGYQVVAESWGAQLDAARANIAALHELVSVVPQGVTIRPLAASDIDVALMLDEETVPDYPPGQAVFHEPLTPKRAQVHARRVAVGAWAPQTGAELIAMTYFDLTGNHAETDFTATHSQWRGHGIATAIKAAGVLFLIQQGITRFRTGGSGENLGILAANAKVGYVVDEKWLTLKRS